MAISVARRTMILSIVPRQEPHTSFCGALSTRRDGDHGSNPIMICAILTRRSVHLGRTEALMNTLSGTCDSVLHDHSLISPRHSYAAQAEGPLRP
ncbi:UNVERIFIED_CONTAM: hypothetical protein Slati_3058200 [Sesamum latifolium]|uniref:Uncharacterized protein n=1 Tax=Sesamum latifolium TaxID=2727402 RepID=A0AAW2UTP2_9LAMI